MRNLTRRDFIKLCGTSSIGLALAACGVTSTPTATPALTNTALPTSNVLPTAKPTLTNTPAPTATATVTATPTPAITVATWASDAKGRVNPQAMYPYVGAVNTKHRQTIDLTMGPLRLAVVNDQDVTKLSEDAQKDSRTKLVARLSQIETLQNQLANARRNLAQANPSETNVTLILEGEKLTQAVIGLETQKKRFSVDAGGGLAEVLHVNLLPRLAFNENGEMIRTDLPKDADRRVQLGGAITVSPIDSQDQWPLAWTLKNIETAKKIGMNLLQLKIVPDLALRNIKITRQIIEEAERNGIYVMLTPSAKVDDYNDIPKPDEVVISSVVKLAQELNAYDNVILDCWNELNLYGNAWNPIVERNALNDMVNRMRAMNNHAIIGIPSGMHSQDFQVFYDNPIEDNNVWYGVMSNPIPQGSGLVANKDARNTWRGLVDRKRPVFYREFNYPERPSEVQIADESKWIAEYLNYAHEHPYQIHYLSNALVGQGWLFDLIAKPGAANAKRIADVPGLANLWFTQRGYLIAQELINHPVTQLDK